MILPLMWNQDQWTATDAYLSHIKYFFIYPMKYQEMAIFGLIAFGIILILLNLTTCACCCYLGLKNKQPLKKRNSGKVSDGQLIYNGSIDSVEYIRAVNGASATNQVAEEPMHYYGRTPVNNDYGGNYYDNQNYNHNNEKMNPSIKQQIQSQQQYPLKRLKDSIPFPGNGRNSTGKTNGEIYNEGNFQYFVEDLKIFSSVVEMDFDYDFYNSKNEDYYSSSMYAKQQQQQPPPPDPYGMLSRPPGGNPRFPPPPGMNGRFATPPPPPPPNLPPPSFEKVNQTGNPGGGGGGGGVRQNLMNEIRQGTTLRKISITE